MALSSVSRRIFCHLFIYVILVSHLCNGFYFSGNYMHTYSTRDVIYAKVNSLTSIETQIPFSYYSLPYCIPKMGIRKSAENLGELLMGDQIVNSPYRFRMDVNESVFLCTTHPLNAYEVNLLKQRTRELYQVNMILDSLPAMRVVKHHDFEIRRIGFPVGISFFNSENDYIINHLKFKVFIRETAYDEEKAYGYEIVGFEVTPCSVKYEPEKFAKLHQYDELVSSVNWTIHREKSQLIREQERISFTYEVEFVKSDIEWSSRWDSYLKMEDANHWFYILNSLTVIFFLAGIVFAMFLRRVTKDLARYQDLDKESDEEVSGWKLVVGDVFREPNNSKLLCVMIADGVQITGMVVFTIVFAVFGFISPASRGMLLTSMIIFYLLMGFPSGYTGVYLYRIIKGTPEGWRSLCWLISCFFPGIVFVIYTSLNFILWANKSTGAISFSLYFMLFSLWFFISVPLTFLGGYLATRAEPIQYPVRINQIAREIPPKKIPSSILVLGAGIFPFVTLFIELSFILSSIWFGNFYNVSTFLILVVLFLVIVCAEVSIVITYMLLCVEDWQWWWKAFYASGSVSIYVFCYSVYYLVFRLLNLSGPVSVLLYLGYSLIIAVAIMLSTGTIGFIMSFFFVHYLFSSVKFD